MKKSGQKKLARRPKKSVAVRSRKKISAPQKTKGHWVSDNELVTLQNSLLEAQETLNAIRSGEVDAVVVTGTRGNQIYSLTGAEQPYRVYIEQMQEGAVTVSSDAMILYCNQRFADMVGHPLERVISSKISAFLHGEAWAEIEKVFQQDKTVKYETSLSRVSEPFLPVNLTASRLPLEGQSVLCLVVTDLTEQKKNTHLNLAKEIAEKANLAKDSFLAALSHELRTPLNPVLLIASEAAENRDLSPSVRSDFATIRNSIELEARLIDDLLDLTRITHGKLTLDLQTVDVHSALKETIQTVKSDIAAKGILLSLDLAAKKSEVKGDAVRLQQIFWNVLKNAVKFTPEKGKIKISTYVAPKENQLIVTVADNGMGMTPGELNRMFQTFAQGEHAADHGSHQFGGLGLGLAISKMLMQMHSGNIIAQSEGRDCGATITINFPLSSVRLQKAAKAIAEKSHLALSENSARTISILLVEDHEPTRNALARLLIRRHHMVGTAASAAEARKLAKIQTFHLVISDIGLPDGSGFELMKELRANHNLKGIALTGYGMEHDVERSRDSGFLAHLTKPVRIQSLENVLAQIMKDSEKA